MDILKKLCLDLQAAETTAAAIHVLKKAGYWDSEDFWHPYGDNPSNATIIQNQSDSARSLVEKFTNVQDQMLILECYKHGINPEGPDAPKSAKEALEKFLHIPNGDLTNLQGSEITELAKLNKFIATGTQDHTNYIIIDQGTGQSAQTMPNTILSLARGNKLKMPFTTGQYTQGGAAVLPYADLQLIISKQHTAAQDKNDITADNVCFTVVRKRDPKKGEKLAVYEYLTPGNKDNGFTLFNFQAKDLQIGYGEAPDCKRTNFNHGTFIKLYNYKKIGPGLITTSTAFKISNLLPNMGLPIRACERRKIGYKDHRDHNIYGLQTRLQNNTKNNLETDPLAGAIEIEGQKIDYSIYVFKKDVKTENYKNKETIILSNKGQNMATIDNHVFERNGLKNIKILKKSVLVIADFSKVSQKYINNIFFTRRDAIREDDPFSEQFEKKIIKQLTANSYLRELANKRYHEELKERTGDDRDLEKIISGFISDDPTLSQFLGIGKSEIKSPLKDKNKGQKTPYEGVRFPTYFEQTKEFDRTKPKNIKVQDSSFMLKFKTNADNDYFNRESDKGTFSLIVNGNPTTNFDYTLNDGNFILHVNNDNKIKPGDIFRYQWIVNDISRTQPFDGEYYVLGLEGKSKPGKGKRNPKKPESLKIPPIILVEKDKWNSENNFNEDSALYISGGGDKINFHVNIDNKYLLNEIRKKPERKLLIQKSWEVSLALMALSKLNVFNKSKDEYDINKRIFEDTRDYCPVLIPLVLRVSKLAHHQYKEAA